MTDGPEAGAGAVPGTDPVSAAQTRAAHAYASVLLAGDVAGPAADDAIAAFRQALTERGDITGGAQSPAADETLLALTRLMTAVSVPDRSQPGDRRQAVWASIGASSHCTCRESAALLATRANGNIQPRESAALDEHLAGCGYCRELSVQTVAAENAFREELTPRGAGLVSLPRAAYAILALLIAAGVGIFAVGTGGSTHRATRAVAAVITHTQAAADTITPLTRTTPAPVAAVRATAPRRHVHPAAAKRQAVAHKPRTVAHKPRTVTHTPRSVAHTSTTSHHTRATTTRSTPVPAAPAAASVSTSAPAATPTPTPTPAAAAPSTAAPVSGQSSLPAESAPQQGIGSLTTAQ